MREVYKGIVRGRQVELEDDALLPEGTRVQVIPEGLAAETSALRNWLQEARQLRAQLSLGSDSAEILREIRQERAGR
jgi:hypothetical protein